MCDFARRWEHFCVVVTVSEYLSFVPARKDVSCACVCVSPSFCMCVSIHKTKGRITSLLLQDRIGLHEKETGEGGE